MDSVGVGGLIGWKCVGIVREMGLDEVQNWCFGGECGVLGVFVGVGDVG